MENLIKSKQILNLDILKVTAPIMYQPTLPNQVAVKSYVDENYTYNIGDNSSVIFQLYHNFGPRVPEVRAYENSSGREVMVSSYQTTPNWMNIEFREPPILNEYKIILTR